MENRIKKIFFLVFISYSCMRLHAQNASLGSWNIINLRYKANNQLSMFGEAQLRSLKFYDHFHYYEYKGGITYQPYQNANFTLAAGSYQTYKEGGNFETPKNNDEFRIWPQITLFQSVGRLNIEQRYRTEMRFTSNGYRNRFRYRLEISKAFGPEKNGFKPFKIGASNELFFTNNEPYFERNRLLFSIGYRPNKNNSLQVGYLHQFDYKINDETGTDFLQIAYSITIF